jgi:hypothetical protein
VLLRITGFLDFIHHPDRRHNILETGLFPSSCEGEETPQSLDMPYNKCLFNLLHYKELVCVL